MLRTKRKRIFIILIFLGGIAPILSAQNTVESKREAMYYRYLEFPSYVKGGWIESHWMADGSSFWYAVGAPENTIIYMVDPKANTKTLLFDNERLRQSFTS